MGWIFFKPIYERIDLVERSDLDNDPGLSFIVCFKARLTSPEVVRLQHKYYGMYAFHDSEWGWDLTTA